MGRAGLCLFDRVTDTSKAISVKGIPHNKSYRTMFLRLSLNNLYLTDLCFEKYNKKKDRSPCWLRRYDGPILPHLSLNCY